MQGADRWRRLVPFLGLLTLACSANKYIDDKAKTRRLEAREAELKTGKEGDWLYHRLAEDPYGLGLRTTGYIVGVEKAAPKTDGSKVDGWMNPDGSPFKRANGKDKLDRILHHRGSKGRRAVMSHIVRSDLETWGSETGRIRTSLYFDAYSREAPDGCPAPDDRDDFHQKARNVLWHSSASAQGCFQEELATALERNRTTHILLYVMGWNTDQEEAIRNFNSLAGYLLEATERDDFRPLVVGVTWDSVAGRFSSFKPASYFSKANDGDEVGAVWLNILLRQSILPAKAAENHRREQLVDEELAPVRLVAIGHSFGARALGTALVTHSLFKDGQLPEAVSPEQIDLVIAMQGAFSVKRFIAGEDHKGKPISKEGAPLQSFHKVAKKWVLTWSRNDTANPNAVKVTGAANAGGWPGAKRISEAAFSDRFECRTWEESMGLRGGGWSEDSSRVLAVDASNIVKYSTHNKGGLAHSDIYTDDMAKLMASLIGHYADGDYSPSAPDGYSYEGSQCQDVCKELHPTGAQRLCEVSSGS